MDKLEKLEPLYPLANGIHQGIQNVMYWTSFIVSLGTGPEEGETQAQWERANVLAMGEVEKEYTRIIELLNKLKAIEL